MAVFLSPVGGVAAQFFDNSGAPLTGGKIYTYVAGTTTPQQTYTSASGSTPHSNPIILDSAGRVSNGGEIWLLDGAQYKFVLKTSTDTLIATYDNITGINSNFVNYTNSQEIQTATAGQTVFTLTTMQYLPGTNSLSVFVDGVNQYGPGAQYAYVEIDATTVTFTTGLHVGAEVKFTSSQINSSAATDASQVAYVPPFTDSVATNVEAKLAQYISVKDFGAVGDGVTDDSAAIQAALDNQGAIYFPPGTYAFATTLVVYGNTKMFGDGPGVSILKWTGASNGDIIHDSSNVTSSDVNLNIDLCDFELDGNSYAGTTTGVRFYRVGNLTVNNIYVHDCGATLFQWGQSQIDTVDINISNSRFENARTGDAVQGVGTRVTVRNCYVYNAADTCYALANDTSPTTNPSNLFSSNVLFEGNTAKGTGAGNELGFGAGPFNTNANAYITVSNNFCENLSLNAWFIALNKLKITGNSFKSHYNTTTGNVRLDGVKNAVIAENSFENSSASTGPNHSSLLLNAQNFVYGMSTFLGDVAKISVTGNVFENNTNAAISIAANNTIPRTVNDVAITGNVFTGANTPISFLPTSGTGSNIFNRISIADNTNDASAVRFVTFDGGEGQYAAIYVTNNATAGQPVVYGAYSNAYISPSYMFETAAVPDGVATTIYTMPASGNRGVQITAYVNAASEAYTAIAVLVNNAGSPRIAWQSDGANCALTLVGNDVRVTQSGIGAQAVRTIISFLNYLQ